jgi:hypothetical protein
MVNVGGFAASLVSILLVGVIWTPAPAVRRATALCDPSWRYWPNGREA